MVTVAEQVIGAGGRISNVGAGPPAVWPCAIPASGFPLLKVLHRRCGLLRGKHRSTEAARFEMWIELNIQL